MLILTGLSGLATFAIANVCKDDINALCEAEKGDRKAIMQCLESNKSDLSSECSAQVDKMVAQREASGNQGRGGVCSDAVAQYCSDAPSEGRGAVVACLESHKSELSVECAAKVDKIRAQ
jgi:hypothetical protein